MAVDLAAERGPGLSGRVGEAEDRVAVAGLGSGREGDPRVRGDIGDRFAPAASAAFGFATTGATARGAAAGPARATAAARTPSSPTATFFTAAGRGVFLRVGDRTAAERDEA